jgi:hypothetical protein
LNILREICEEFKEAGVLPLHLRTLHLGTGIMLYNNAERQCLGGLTSLSALESLHIYNKSPFRRGEPREEDSTAYFTFSSVACPLLRRVSVATIISAYINFLNLVAADTSLPEHFMSEIACDGEYDIGALSELKVNEEKRKSWPKMVLWKWHTPSNQEVRLRRGLWERMTEWKGLERLGVYVDLRFGKEWVNIIPHPFSLDLALLTSR